MPSYVTQPKKITVSPSQFTKMRLELLRLDCLGYSPLEAARSVLSYVCGWGDTSEWLGEIEIEVDWALKEPTQAGRTVDWGGDVPRYMVDI